MNRQPCRPVLLAALAIAAIILAACTARQSPSSATPGSAVVRWIDLALDATKQSTPAPPQAARALAFLSSGMYDALRAAEAQRVAGLPTDDEAALAAVAVPLLSHFYPAQAERFAAAAAPSLPDTAAVARGRLLGATTARTLVAQALADGADALGGNGIANEPTTAGSWQPTTPDYWSPLLPGWGSVRAFAIAGGSSLRVPAPPPWDGPAMAAERAAFIQIQARLSDADRALAKRWAGDMGTVTPAGLWNETARELVLRHGLDAAAAARVFAALNIAQHDAMIACWESKYYYRLARPVQWMASAQPAWAPTILTPPFPSYPSGHAAVSGAASTVLGALFPGEAAAIRQQAHEVAWSRVVGGIHWPLDSTAGLAQGKLAGEAALRYLRLP